ncbi:hypothetical protein GWK47_022684 [Chionoecetes opilio]|uniref:Uncharacterized protein n=1 Tax=Chionoecetes opilio TaxID=41210 RepID=A0A8J5CFB2_CHIOP|nr:hypothetical protein GWK47_022684 [Chionoecetes opilio]
MAVSANLPRWNDSRQYRSKHHSNVHHEGMQRGKHLHQVSLLLVMPLDFTRTPCTFLDQQKLHLDGREGERVSGVSGLHPEERKLQLNQKQSPHCDVFAAKGYDAAVQVPSRPPHPSIRRSRPAEVGHINLLLFQWCLPPGQARLFPAVDPSSSQCFLFSRLPSFCLPVFGLFSAFNLRSDICLLILGLKCRPAPSSVPFHKDED